MLTFTADRVVRTGLLAGVALAGGWIASRTVLPLPWMLGSLFATALFAPVLVRMTGALPAVPDSLRRASIAVIGVMIGASFSPVLMAMLPSLWVSLFAMLAFVVLSHAVGYQIYRRIGGYDKTLALYASMPGGLLEAITLGESAGCDPRVLTVQHFTRIIVVVITVPLLLFAWKGSLVGSAAGETLSTGLWAVSDIVTIALLAAIGLVLAPRVRLPAGHLMAPLLVSALLHATALITIVSPDGLLACAQLVVGAGLGTRFVGFGRRELTRALTMSGLSVSIVLVLSGGFALALSGWVDVPLEALFIAFAPGGVTEMSLIALSFGVSPMLVALHHLLRIVLTVASVTLVLRRFV